MILNDISNQLQEQFPILLTNNIEGSFPIMYPIVVLQRTYVFRYIIRKKASAGAFDQDVLFEEKNIFNDLFCRHKTPFRIRRIQDTRLNQVVEVVWLIKPEDQALLMVDDDGPGNNSSPKDRFF
jgi:hypothetical protein